MRILLAEDDKRLGKLIKYMLEQNHIQVEWVQDGSEIYDYATYTDYDILVLDWMMPGESGVDACRRLRKEGYERAILMLTARDSVEDRVTPAPTTTSSSRSNSPSSLRACALSAAAARRKSSRRLSKSAASR